MTHRLPHRLTPRFVPLAAIALLTLSAAFGGPIAAQDRPAPDTTTTLPLKTARTHTFTTTKGSWLSLDVSPDGSQIVFDLLGDLYTLPIAGGKATRLTSGMGFDAQPRFSPDGKKVVFISDRSGGENVWIQSLDGKDSTQVTKGNNNMYVSPEWTPDGAYVVSSRGGGLGGAAKLWMYNVNGGNGLPLTTEPALPATQKLLGAAFGKDRSKFTTEHLHRLEDFKTTLCQTAGIAYKPMRCDDIEGRAHGPRSG